MDNLFLFIVFVGFASFAFILFFVGFHLLYHSSRVRRVLLWLGVKP